MKCKYCQGELPEDGVSCPYCGKNNLQEPQEEVFDTAGVVEEILEEEDEAVILVSDEEPQEEEVSQVEETMASPQVKKMKRMAIFSGCIAVLAILGTVLFFAIRGGFDVGSLFDWMKPRENNVYYKDSYTVSDKKVQSKHDVVVATLGDKKLTNGELQVYYWMQVIDFIDQYGYYLSYVGMDYTKPLDQQQSMDGKGTWQQYFLEAALDVWRSNQTFAIEAEKNGFQLEKKYQDYLDGLESSLLETAQKEKLDSVEALLQKEMGAGCTFADYQSYMQVYYNGYLYFNELYEKIDPTDAQIEAYFTKNEASFAEQKITKDSGKYYSIRNILIGIEGGTKDEDGKLTYTEDQWNANQQEAQKLLDQWLAGEVTEEAFAELAQKHSDDTNSKSNGGMYSGFAKGDLKQLFGEGYDTWCTAEERKEGDYALLKTDYGYQLVYFVASEDIWFAEARSAYMSEEGAKIMEEAMAKYELQVDYKKITLGEVKMGAN